MLKHMKFKFKSIRSRIIFLILIFMVIPMICISFVSFRRTEKIISKKVLDLSINNMDQLCLSFQQITYSLVHASNVITMDQDLMRTLEEDVVSDYDYLIKRTKIVEKITSALAVNLRCNSIITIIDKNGNVYRTWNSTSDDNSSERFLSSEWYHEARKLNGNILWIIPHEDYTSGVPLKSNRKLISIARMIKGYLDAKEYGVLLISTPINEIEYELNKMVDTKFDGFFITDKEGRTILKTRVDKEDGINNVDWCIKDISNYGNVQFTSQLEGQKMEVVVKDINNLDLNLKAVFVIPHKDMFSEVKRLERENLLIIVTVMIIFTFILVLIAFNLTKPLKNLIFQMSRIKEGNLELEIKVNSKDEIGQLTQKFNDMLGDIKQLMTKVSIEEKEKKEAYLKALQAQINPHFLFNTLNAIKWTAYLNGNRNVGNMVASLEKLFEITINKSSEYITIREEIEFISSYIKLMGIRYNQGFNVNYNIEPNLMSLYTLKFILQPIVENSIIHGFNDCNYEKRITISCMIESGKLIFKVSDNGRGIPAEKIEKMLNLERNVDSSRFTGIGISNVNERIKLNFGDEFGIKIESTEGIGTTVIISIPVLEKEPERNNEYYDKSSNCR